MGTVAFYSGRAMAGESIGLCLAIGRRAGKVRMTRFGIVMGLLVVLAACGGKSEGESNDLHVGDFCSDSIPYPPHCGIGLGCATYDPGGTTSDVGVCAGHSIAAAGERC